MSNGALAVKIAEDLADSLKGFFTVHQPIPRGDDFIVIVTYGPGSFMTTLEFVGMSIGDLESAWDAGASLT